MFSSDILLLFFTNYYILYFFIRHKFSIITNTKVKIYLGSNILPITFILSGLFLLLSLFDVIMFKNHFFKLALIIANIFIILSFFASNIRIGNVYFNLFQFVPLIIFWGLSINKVYGRMCTILLTIVCCFLYFYCLKCFEIQSGLSRDVLLIFVAILSTTGFKSNLFSFIFTSFVCVCINCYFDMVEFTFSIIDLNIIFELIILYWLFIYVIRILFVNKYKYGGDYVKKNKFNNTFNIDVSDVSC